MNDQPDIKSQLTAYIDGELPELEARRVAQALEANPSLKALEQQLRSAVGAVQRLPSPAPSADLRRAVMNRLDEPAGLGERLAGLFTLPRLVPVAGALAAAAVAVAVVGGHEQHGPEELEQLAVAQNLELLESFEVVGLDGAADLEVVASLHELEELR